MMNTLTKYGIKAVNRVRRKRPGLPLDDSQRSSSRGGTGKSAHASATTPSGTSLDKSSEDKGDGLSSLMWRFKGPLRSSPRRFYSADMGKEFLVDHGGNPLTAEEDTPLGRDLSAPLPSRRPSSLNEETLNEIADTLSLNDLLQEIDDSDAPAQEHGLEALQDLEQLRGLKIGVPHSITQILRSCIIVLFLHLLVMAGRARFPSSNDKDGLVLLRWKVTLLERVISWTGWASVILVVICLRAIRNFGSDLEEARKKVSAAMEKVEGHVSVMMASIPQEVPKTPTPKGNRMRGVSRSPRQEIRIDRGNMSPYSSPPICLNASVPVSPALPMHHRSSQLSLEDFQQGSWVDTQFLKSLFSANGSAIMKDFTSVPPRTYLQYLRMLASPTDLPPNPPWAMDPCCVRFVADNRSKRALYKVVKSHMAKESIEQAGLGDRVSLFWPDPIQLNMRVNIEGSGLEPAIYAFRTPLFEGHLLMRCLGFDKHYNRDFDDSQMRSYFAKHKRVMQWVVQGRFKERVPMNSVLTGQLFEKSLNLPPALIVRLSMMVMKAFNVLQADDITHPQLPYVITPLITACQTVVVTDPNRPGAVAPDMGSLTPIKDDLSDQGPEFVGWTAKQRRAFFSNLHNLNSFSYEPGLLYTFESYQHLFRFDTFAFSVGLKQLDIIEYLNEQPLEINCFVDRAYGDSLFPGNGSDRIRGNIRLRLQSPSQYLWRLQVIHKRMKVA